MQIRICVVLVGMAEVSFGIKSEETSETHQLAFKVQQLCSGQSHTLFLDIEGNVWACGWNAYGQLGLVDLHTDHDLTKIEGLPPIVSLTSKYNHTMAVDESGGVWAFGWNYSYQLGIAGCNISNNVPTKLSNLPLIQAVSTGKSFSLFLDVDGCVWGCGDNQHGQLGCREPPGSVTKPVMLKDLPRIQLISAGMSHSALFDSFSCMDTFFSNRNSPQNCSTNLLHCFRVRIFFVGCWWRHLEGSYWGRTNIHQQYPSNDYPCSWSRSLSVCGHWRFCLVLWKQCQQTNSQWRSVRQWQPSNPCKKCKNKNECQTESGNKISKEIVIW